MMIVNSIIYFCRLQFWRANDRTEVTTCEQIKLLKAFFFIPRGDISSKGQNPFNLVLDLFVNMSAK